MRQDRTVVDSSGLVEVDEQLPANVDAANLQDLCRGRNHAIDFARASAEQSLRGMVLDDNPISAERKAMLYRSLGAVSTYQNDVERAIKEFKSGRDLLAQWTKDTGPDEALPDARGDVRHR